MKILHLSHQKLPDWRVEKAALTSLKLGSEVFFAGRGATEREYKKSKSQIFSKTFAIDWTPLAKMALPFYWQSVKKQVKQIVHEVKPDIVHAHNVFSAKIISEFKIPFVYDDAEYWSQYAKLIAESRAAEDERSIGIFHSLKNQLRKFIKDIAYSRAVSLWTTWEGQLVSSVPTITVSKPISEGLKKMWGARAIFLVPNFPLLSESANFTVPIKYERLSSVYVGADNKYRQPVNRVISGLADVFLNRDIGNLTIIGGWEAGSFGKVKATGFLSRNEMFDEMLGNSVGLVPFKKHWSHYFLNPNKAYEYAHAGLLVMVTSDLTAVIETLGDNCVPFEDFEDLASKLEYFKNNMGELHEKRISTFNFARKNLIWENYEKNILRAYEMC